MDNPIPALLGTALVSLAIGFGGAYLILDQEEGPKESTDAKVTKTEAKTEAEKTPTLRVKGKDPKAKAAAKDLRPELKTLKADLVKRDKAIDALKIELHELKNPRLSLEDIAKLPFDKLSDEQKAQIKKRGVEQLQRLMDALKGGDKATILNEMAKLRDLGLAARTEFISGYNQVSAIGNPWVGIPEMNKLGLSKAEYGNLMTEEFAHYAAMDNGDEVGEGARIHSTYMIGWSRAPGVTMEDRVSQFDNIFRTARSPYLTASAAENIAMMENPQTGEMLINLALDANLPIATRTTALTLVVAQYATQISEEQIKSLEEASKSEFTDALRYLKNVRVPSTSGYLVRAFERGSQGQLAGVKIGDIITIYNGVAVDSVTTLLTLQGEAKGKQVKLTVHRDGQDKDYTVGGGPIGMEGLIVTR